MPRVLVDTEMFPFVLGMKDLEEYPPATYPYENDLFRFSHYKYSPERISSMIVHGFTVQELLPYQKYPGSYIHPPRFGIVEYHLPRQSEVKQIEEWIKYPEMSLPHLLIAISPDDNILESIETYPTLIAGSQFSSLDDAIKQLNHTPPSPNITHLGSELTTKQWNRLLFPFNDQPLPLR